MPNQVCGRKFLEALSALRGICSAQEVTVLDLNCEGKTSFHKECWTGLFIWQCTSEFSLLLVPARQLQEFKVLSVHSLYGIDACSPANFGSQNRWHLLFSMSCLSLFYLLKIPIFPLSHLAILLLCKEDWRPVFSSLLAAPMVPHLLVGVK